MKGKERGGEQNEEKTQNRGGGCKKSRNYKKRNDKERNRGELGGERAFITHICITSFIAYTGLIGDSGEVISN